MLLEVDGLCVNYGHIEAIRDITFGVEEGQVTTLIGANGAGKTTTLKTISGLRKVRAGQDHLRRQGHHPRCRRSSGSSWASASRLRAAAASRACRCARTSTWAPTSARTARPRRTSEDLERVFTLFPRLEERANQSAGTMSGGEQQMLAIGRALMARPRLVLLDEPSMGWRRG